MIPWKGKWAESCGKNRGVFDFQLRLVRENVLKQPLKLGLRTPEELSQVISFLNSFTSNSGLPANA